ncbi:hypothetical protein K6119_02360 [Paracrocinitomix mangrovi]|uniref:hypothetical protein n=1 Tax=Paracrocinitomix mangrovi TaxID=2862509 RepID=UPI001C8E42A6|nr:hypothetical protein [Paracrocinitomix mangrovi]UKN02363.1 hypothetical protein K6119_02360 [Paracrocinitomix mangrovi]
MLDSLQIALRDSLILDPGPFYHEFHHESWLREPWNAISSMFFFIPIIFWIYKLRGRYKENLIIVAILPLLFLNGLGSTLFHAFRTEDLFFFLDVMPASAMSLTLSVYLWTKLVKRWYLGLAIVLGFYVLAYFTIRLFMQFEGMEEMAPNFGYFFVGASFFAPILIILGRTKFYHLRLVVLTFLFLGLALACRASDYPTPNPFPDLLPQGTHFMWHIFSAFAVFTMGYYIYFINKINLRDRSTFPKRAL